MLVACSRENTITSVQKNTPGITRDKRLGIITVMSPDLPREDYLAISRKFYSAFRENHEATIHEGDIVRLMPPGKYAAMVLALHGENVSAAKAASLISAAAIPGVDYILLLRVERLNIREYREAPAKGKLDFEARYCTDHIIEMNFYLFNQASGAMDISGASGNHRAECIDNPKESDKDMHNLVQGKLSLGFRIAGKPGGTYPDAVPLQWLLTSLTEDIRGVVLVR